MPDTNAPGVDPMPKRRLGLIVNPIAGLGGTVALNGTDGVAADALRRGATPRAAIRAVEALRSIVRDIPDIEICCYDGEMGGASVRAAGVVPHVVGVAAASPSTAEDTRRAARDLLATEIDLLLFSGGDGTACDLVDVVGTRVPVLGIPAGVKMHSGVFATTPVAAGLLASREVSVSRHSAMPTSWTSTRRPGGAVRFPRVYMARSAARTLDACARIPKLAPHRSSQRRWRPSRLGSSGRSIPPLCIFSAPARRWRR
jgi:hypothetical protein